MSRIAGKSLLVLQIALCVCSLLAGATVTTRAAEITFLCASALRPAMDEIVAEFRRTSGHNVKISFATIGVNADRIRKGDAADLAIVSPSQWDELRSEGKLDAGTRALIAKIGIGVFIKRGAAKPDVSSVEGIKRALLDAPSIAVPVGAGNPVAAYAVRLFDRLDIATQLKSKNVVASGGSPIQAVARGEADIGFTQISEVIAEPRIEYAGPFPAEIQNYTVFAAAIPTNATERDAAKAFADFLRSASAITIFRSKGLEPA